MRLTSLLRQIYEPFGNEWVGKNDFVFTTARRSEITLAGSIALSVIRKKAIRTPGDIDFVCPSVDAARNFISSMESFLFKRSCYWRVLVNNRTEFCPDGCTAHFRFVSPFWLPVCVMVIPVVNHWRISPGNFIQNYEDVVEAAKLLDERDGKGRVEYEEPREIIRMNVNDFDDMDFSISPEEQTYQPKNK